MYLIPIITTVLALIFFGVILKYYLKHSNTSFMLWLAIGFVAYGAGTFAESYHSIYGFSDFNFKLWYITGALLGGWSLVTGIMYHLLSKKIADMMMLAGVIILLFISACSILSPIDAIPDNTSLNGSVFHWKFIRPMTSFFHIYSFILLTAFAFYAAFQYSKSTKFKERFLGILTITAGGLLPGLGRSHSNMDISYSFYVTELLGLILIFAGCLMLLNDKAPSTHQYSKPVQS